LASDWHSTAGRLSSVAPWHAAGPQFQVMSWAMMRWVVGAISLAEKVAAADGEAASAEGRRVALSGQGADEILSDYSPWPDQSELKGVFPNDLRLWPNFNYSCQESYLMKEEYAGGAFGIETRYPYLDRDVVQEFLSLSADAKNQHYKAPLREYLVRNQYPFEEDVKRGFKIDLPRFA
jgi:asparagine synthetase B (glutamine-hydrolysing)